MPKVIAVIPVYNEEKTLWDILSRVSPQVDLLICVNDGSVDRTRIILREFSKCENKTFVLNLPSNVGMAGAIKNGFLFVLYLLKMKIVKDDDIVVTIDADGQHKPEYIRKIIPYLIRKKVDVVLTRRDFSVYPKYKKIGNYFLTWTNSILSGIRYKDVESGMRFLRVKTIRPILSYYTGIKYSCAQEIALISAKMGFKIDNDFLVEIAYYRPGTTFADGFIVLFLSFFTFARCVLGIRSCVSIDSKLIRRSFLESRKTWFRKNKGSS